MILYALESIILQKIWIIICADVLQLNLFFFSKLKVSNKIFKF
jgi:hypothetical protein